MQREAGASGNRWHRLRPRDPTDGMLIAVMVVGVVLYGANAFWEPSLGPGWLLLTLEALLMTHASSPPLLFFALAFFLVRWGRTLGANKRWVWAGLLVTLPLWLLAGLPVAIRGAGDITVYFVLWNLVALAVMATGVRRTLGPVREKDKDPAPR